MLALDEGYEGFGWRVFESGRALGKELKATLAKSLLDYFNDPTVPTSGDELTFFMTKEIMNRLAPSLLVVNFWDIDIAHYGAYSLYLEAIRRTDRLVHELWQHVQSLPRVPRSHDAARRARAGTRQRRRRQRVREPSQRRRVVPPRVAGGARRGRAAGVPAPSGPSAPSTSRRPSRASSGSRCRTAKARPLASWPSRGARMQFDAKLTGEAAALARAHDEVLAGCRPPFTRSSSSSCRSGRRCSRAEQRYQRALLEHLSRLPQPRSCCELSAGSRGSKPRPGCDRIARAQSRALPGSRRRRCCESRTSSPAGGARSIGSSSRSIRRSRRSSIPPDAPRRLVVQLYGGGIAVQPDKLWSRFKRDGMRMPLSLDGVKNSEASCARCSASRRRERQPALLVRHAPERCRLRRRPTPGSSSRTRRSTTCSDEEPADARPR